MLTRSLKTLAAVAPGHAFTVMLEIAALEKQLGLPHGRPTFNGVRAKARLADLQAQLASKSTPQVQAAPAPAPAPTPTVPAPVAPAPAPAPAPATVPALSGLARAAASFKADAITAAETRKLAPVATAAPVAAGSMPTEKLAAMCAHVFGSPVSHADDPQTRQKCLARLHIAGVNVAGMEADPHSIEITGTARSLRAVYQAKAVEFLSVNPK